MRIAALMDSPRMYRLWQKPLVLSKMGYVHVLDLVLPSRLSVSCPLAKLDRGSYAKPAAAWRNLLCQHLSQDLFEPYGVGPGLWSMV